MQAEGWEDFERLARVGAAGMGGGRWQRRMGTRVAAGARCVLEVGCGTGSLAREIAACGVVVTAVDGSAEMLRIARGRVCESAGAIDFVRADFMQWQAPRRYDCVVSVATLHHLPFEPALEKMAGLVAEGGRLIVHDLFAPHGVVDAFASAAALGLRAVERLIGARPRESKQVAAAWRDHHDVLMTLADVRRHVGAVLPGARVRRHLEWRYTIEWTRT